ncbi:MAG: type II secretion system protein [Deltaproteobacteria bacterium]|nr:type II secretion system protein [Deltaproteobacteria bacterium]
MGLFMHPASTKDMRNVARTRVLAHDQCGLSIVEIVMALAILGIVAAALSRVTQAVSASAASEEARRGAKQEMAQAIAMFTRDVDKLDYTQLGSVVCNGLTCKIPTKDGVITYTTSCIASPPTLSTVDLLAVAPGQCLTVAACPKGRMPVLDMARPGDPVRRYPLKAAGGSGGVTKNAVGAMACFRRPNLTEIAINLTYFYLQTRESPKMIRHSLTLPTMATPGMQIIRDHL